MKNLRPCKFTFDNTPPFSGFALGTTWNGFDNVAVTLATAHEIDRWFATEQAIYDYPVDGFDIIASLPVRDGLISLAYGFTTIIVEG